jgi:hypothetical protein
MPALNSARFLLNMALAIGRTLNEPIGCRFSSFNRIVLPGGARSQSTTGEIMLKPVIRARAALI